MRKITKIEPKKELFKPKLRVAAYARVSSGKDAMLHSLSAQVSYYSNLIQKRVDWAFAGVYADEALTGTKQERPQFLRLMEDCRNGKIDMVITKAISRFARNTVTTLTYVRELKALGIAVYFEEENINSLSKDGELMLTVLSAFAQEQSYNVSEDCKWRIKKDFEEGKLPLSTKRFYGYKRDKDGGFHIVESEAEVVRYIFNRYLEGYGMTAISKELNEKGLRTLKGYEWDPNVVKYLLTNEKYFGGLLLQKSYVEDHLTKKKRVNRGELPQYYVEENHEPIVSKEVFDAVQTEMKKRHLENKGTPATENYLFTGLIKCMNCGKYYRRKVSNCSNKYRRVFWNCSTFLTKGKSHCHTKQIPEDTLLELTDGILDKIQEIQVSEWNKLLLVFKDGSAINKTWQDKSRKWTDEMKQENYYNLRKGNS